MPSSSTPTLDSMAPTNNHKFDQFSLASACKCHQFIAFMFELVLKQNTSICWSIYLKQFCLGTSRVSTKFCKWSRFSTMSSHSVVKSFSMAKRRFGHLKLQWIHSPWPQFGRWVVLRQPRMIRESIVISAWGNNSKIDLIYERMPLETCSGLFLIFSKIDLKFIFRPLEDFLHQQKNQKQTTTNLQGMGLHSMKTKLVTSLIYHCVLRNEDDSKFLV